MAKSPDAYRQKRVPQLRPWSPVASVDAYGKAVCYDIPIAGNVKHGSGINSYVRCKSSPAFSLLSKSGFFNNKKFVIIEIWFFQ